MNTIDQEKPVLISSLFRTGSTYMFSVFRRSGRFTCYQEPENEFLLNLNSNPEALVAGQGETARTMRHPAMDKPYMQEFYDIADQLKGLFKKSFCYDEYFTPPTPSSNTSFINYLAEICKHSQRRPVLQFCRASGRISAIKHQLDAVAIHLWREPRSQWWSYKINEYFDAATLLIYQSGQIPNALRQAFTRIKHHPLHSCSIVEEFKNAYRTTMTLEQNYFLFFALWLYSFLENERYCDISAGIDALSSTTEAKKAFFLAADNYGIEGIQLDDCAIPLIKLSSDESLFYQRIEADVFSLFKTNGYSAEELETARSAVAPWQKIDGHASTEAVQARQIAFRMMSENAKAPPDNKQRIDASPFENHRMRDGRFWHERNLGPESRKAHQRRLANGFFSQYFSGTVLDIGYRGYEDIDVVPVLPDTIGVDLNYPGYDGKTLPFAEGSVDTAYSSHTLEHISDPIEALREWFRVLRVGGFLVITVPHQFLYEKRTKLPSRWNLDHKRFYTPAVLMGEIEAALHPNTYRVRHLVDDDEFYDYTIPPERHAGGAYQIELVIEKIKAPDWQLECPDNKADKIVPAIPHTEDILQIREAETRKQLLEAFTAIKEVLLDINASHTAATQDTTALHAKLLIQGSKIIDLQKQLPKSFEQIAAQMAATKERLDALLAGIDTFIAEQNI